jgi:hypothetical protein
MINMNIVNIILGVSLIIFGGLILLGAPLMYLWNYVVPSIFGLRYITFWEAVGLNLVTGILFRPSILPFEAFNKIKNKIS